jgi:exoribonuclease R
VMATTDRTGSTAERGAVELAEAVLLQHRVGEKFEAAVLDVDNVPVQRRTAATTAVPAAAATAVPAAAATGDGRPDGKRSAKPARRPGGTVALDDPPVRARCEGELPLGERVAVRLVSADPVKRKVLFERV